MKLITASTPNKYPGGNTCQVIIIHHWDDPAKHPTLQGVVSRFEDPSSQLSAHYVVTDETVIQMCAETDRAWHARQANDFAIGIEVDPNTPGKTYETVGELVRQIRSRRGDIPLKKHSDYVKTDCPGSVDLSKIEQYAKGDNMVSDDVIRNVVRIQLTAVLGLDGNGIVTSGLGKRPSAIRKECEGIVESYIPYFRDPADGYGKILEFWSSTQGTNYHDKEIPQIYSMAQAYKDGKTASSDQIAQAVANLKEAQDALSALLEKK